MSPFGAGDLVVWALSLAAVSWLAVRRWARVKGELAAAEAAREAANRELERRSRELEAVNRVAAAIGSRADLAVAAEAIVDAVLGLTGLTEAAVYRLDRATGTLRLIAQRGYAAEEIALLDGRPVEQTVAGRVILEGRSSINAVAESPSLAPSVRELAARHAARNQLSLPIAVGGVPWGVLALVSSGPVRFTPDEVRLLEALADQISISVERAELLAGMRANTRRLETLAQLAHTLTSTLSPREVLDTLLAATVRFFPEGAVRLWLIEGEMLVLDAEAGVRRLEGLPPLDRVPFGQGLAGCAAATREPVVSADLLADPRVVGADWSRAQGFVSGAAFPFVARGQLLGVLSVFARARHEFTPEEVRALESFSHQAAIAMDNAKLFQAADHRSLRLATLATLTGSLTATLSLEEVLTRVVQSAVDLFGSSVSRLWLIDEGGQTLSLRAHAGAQAPVVGVTRLAVGEGLMGRVVASRTALVVEDLHGDGRVRNAARIQAEGVTSFAGVPLLLGDRVLGALSIALRTRRRFADEDLSLLHSLSSQAAIAIENARLYAETARRLEETRALLDVARILDSTIEPRPLLRLVAIKIAQVCRVDRCTIERWDGDRIVPLASQFADGRAEPGRWRAFVTEVPAYAPREVPAYARAIRSRQPVVFDDLADTDEIPREWITRYAHRSCAIVPLVQHDRVIGGLILDYCERPTAFSAGQVDLARAIGGQLALALENSRLYAEVQHRLRESATLVEVGRALARPGTPADVMRAVARVVARAMRADMAAVYALTPRRDALVPIAAYRVPRHLLDALATRRFELSRFGGLLESWRAGRAIWSSNVHADPRFDRSALEGIDPHAVLGASTPMRGEPVGGLFLVWWGGGREFSPEEIQLVQAVAAQVGLAMENAELARQTQTRLAETETLLAVSRTLASTLDLETMPRHFLRHIVHALNADTAGVWLLDETGQWLEPLAGYRVPKATLEALRGVRIPITGLTVYGQAARTLRCVVSMEGDRDPRVPRELREAIAHRMQLFVPIVANERLSGGFAVTWTAHARALSDGELRLVEAVASQAGAAFANARLFRDNQRRVEELSVLHQLSRAVTGRLDQTGLIETIHQQVARVLDVQHLVVLLHDEARDTLEVALRIVDGRPDAGEPHRYPAHAGGLMSVVFDTGRPLRTADYAGECTRRGLPPMPAAGAPRHWLGVPMAADGQILGVLGLRSHDRTFSARDERLLASIADLAALALRSARLFEDRTRAYGELAAAQDGLVRTEKLRALGEMASGVAHDFNNVLAAIVGRAQLLLREVREPRLVRWLEVIERSALDGANTVRRLQEFTRIRRDQPFVLVDLNEVAREALEGTESRWREEPPRRGIAVEVRTALAADLPGVTGDPSELREALINLILNALDAMPAGGTLTLETSRADDEARLAVGDTGVGIPAHVRGKIFDPFFTTKGPQGTGLGLSMTYGILSRHGARVTLDSEEGRGTTFVLHFPVAESAPTPAAQPPSADAAETLRCLVVDDEALVGDVMGDMLVSLGHRPVVLQRGEEAVARFDREPFDVVFTDLSMPGLSGWDVARAIRASSAATPVFLVTGFGVEVSPDDLGAEGVEAVLAKPLSLQDMIGALAIVRRRS